MPDEIATLARADRGPVADACLTLAQSPALRDHLTITESEHGDTILFRHDDGPPFVMWGSGAQCLWRLLLACCYRGQTVSLYDVVARLDRSNRIAVVAAIHALAS